VCRATGVGSVSYWKNKEGEALEKKVGYGSFKRCEVAHGMPWSVDQPYWELVRRLLGVSGSPTTVYIAENAMLLQAPIHQNFQNYMLYFDPGFVLRRRTVGGVHLSDISEIIHVRQGVSTIDGRFLDLPILPCQTNPSVPDVKYAYFLLHKLIGDIVYMAGGAETLGLDEFGLDEDPWTSTHLVSELSLPALDDELYRIQVLRQPVIDNPPARIAIY